jgi:hypothetical protein
MVSVESKRAEVPTGAPPRARRRRLPAPLWRFAPRRLFSDLVNLALMVTVLTMVAVAASAGPLYAEAVSDAAVRLVLATVPEGAPARQAPVARLNGGIDPESTQWSGLLTSLREVPGLAEPRVTVQSVSAELHPSVFYNPVGTQVSGPGGGEPAPARLFGVVDPTEELVVTSQAAGSGEGVWLPDPVARSTGAVAGDQVKLQLSGLPETPVATTRVAGTYAVQADGRTPQNPPGQRLWSDIGVEAFPSDAEEPTRRAHLVVADLATTAAVAKDADDPLLWSALSLMDDPTPRLGRFHRTAEAVAELRRRMVASSELGEGPTALRPSVASGIVDLATEADELSGAAQRGAAVTTRVGILLALALVVAATGYSMGRRRREVALAAGTGRRPASAGLLHVAELVPAALVAGVLGWLTARVMVGATVGEGSPTRSTVTTAGLWCVGAVVTALVAAGTVAGAATRRETRRLEGRPELRVPWVVVLVVVAVSATAGLLTRPISANDPLGPLDLLVPPLVVAAIAAIGATAFFALLRRGRSSARPPTPRTMVTWLARRRLQAPDSGRDAATTIAATGLAMLVFSLSSLTSLQHTVEDRAAEEAGAHTVDRISYSYQLDPSAPMQAAEPADGSPLKPGQMPLARNPTLPDGRTLVWRARTTVATSGDNINLLIVDPTHFAEAAAWGSPGGPVSQGKALLPALADQDAAAAAATRRQGVAVEVPVLLVGEVGNLDLEVGSAVAIDTLNDTVRLSVRGVLPAFPGAGTGQPTFVVPADSFFASQYNNDPRLRPRPGTPRNRPVEFQSDLWSSTAAGASETLARYAIDAQPIGTLAAIRATPVYVAAEQARRYQIALGLVFGVVGLAAVALAAVRLARRSPAADRMLAWAGAGPRTPARARVLEVAVVLAVSAVLASVALLSLRPMAHILLEPGDGRTPEAVLLVPGSALIAGAAWLLVAATAAVVGMALAARAQSTVEVLRGED